MKVLLPDFLFDGKSLYRDKAVVVDNGLTVDVGNFKNIIKIYSDIEVEDLSGGVLFPGFVNTHVHLELGYLKGKIPKHIGFVKWLEYIRGLKIEDRSIIVESIREGVGELIRSGVFICGDVSNTLLSVETLRKFMPDSVIFYENYSLDKNKACEVANNLRRFDFTDFSEISLSVVPHSVYSTHPCLAKLICSFDSKPFSIHFLESAFEEQFLRGEGMLFEFLKENGLVSDDFYFNDIWEFLEYSSCVKKNAVFVHCVEADDEDIKKIEEIDGTVCLCLRSNDYISSKLPDVYKMVDSSINIAIGTDSLASNDDLNFLNELKFLYLNFPNLSPDLIFKWAIVGGAVALNKRVGFFKGHLCMPLFAESSSYDPLASILEKGGETPLKIINA